MIISMDFQRAKTLYFNQIIKPFTYLCFLLTYQPQAEPVADMAQSLLT